MTTNAFTINGVAFTRQPTNHRWRNQDTLGISGDGHAMYPAYREYELEFDFSTQAEFYDFNTYWQSVGQTGTVVVELPEHPTTASTYGFREYSGVVVNQPEYQSFFENYYGSGRILLTRIRTS